LHLNATFLLSPPPASTHDKMDHDTRIEAAIRDLDLQERPNIATTAIKYNTVRRTLAYRFKDGTSLNCDVTSYSQKAAYI
jgi:hypothetical protein